MNVNGGCMKPIGVGIIGCGTICMNHLVPVIHNQRTQLVAVCDCVEEKAKKIATDYNCKYYTDYTDMLGNEEIQVVHILLPHYLHTPVARMALEKGKHVILEKPVGINFQELKQLQETAEKTGLVVGVTFQNRFNPTTIAMKQKVMEGALGEFKGAKGIVTWCRDDAYYTESGWRGSIEKEGGGVLINQAIHALDLMQYIGGVVKKIDACCTNFYHPNIEVEDTATIVLFYENGSVGNFYATNNYADNSAVELEFVFEKGSLRLYEQDLYVITQGETQSSSQIIASDINLQGEKSYWGQGHKECITNIYDHILLGDPLRITLEEAIKGTELVLRAYASDVNSINQHTRQQYQSIQTSKHTLTL